MRQTVFSNLRLNPIPPEIPVWRFINSVELARLCNVAPQTLWNWRVRGSGPPGFQDRSRRWWYRLCDVLAWASQGQKTPDEICEEWIRTRIPGHWSDTMTTADKIRYLEKRSDIFRLPRMRQPSQASYVETPKSNYHSYALWGG